MTTNGSSNNENDHDTDPQAERVEVRRVETRDDDGGRSHVRIHHTYGRQGGRARLRLGWRAWLAVAAAGLVVVGLVALALTVMIYLLPVILVIAAALLLARWIQRGFGGRR
ncbi:MAG: hypothetical protein ACOC95_00315 [Planctomycetota bacterium]